MDYNAAKIYVAVVSQGSFSGAAKALKMPVSTVSRKVSELEESMELRLLERSTRHLRLTEPGEVFYEFAERSIAEAEAGLLALQNSKEDLEGTLRLSIAFHFEPIWPVLKGFKEKYPNVKMVIQSYPGAIDFIADGLDIAIVRTPTQNPNHVVRKLGGSGRKVVAAPDYIDSHGQPTFPSELQNHECLTIGLPKPEEAWIIDGEHYPVSSNFVSNDYRMLKYLCMQGQGIANLPTGICVREIDRGTLVEIFDSRTDDDVEFQLVYPSRRLISSITRAFIDHCMEYVDGRTTDEWYMTVDMP